MRYLITGSGGFIGRYIFEELKKQSKPGDVIVGVNRSSKFDYNTTVFQNDSYTYNYKVRCDLENPDEVYQLMQNAKPDVIFHFAGCATVSSPPDKIWIANVDTTFNLLQYAPKGCKFILASSINAEKNNTVYAASKIAAETLVETYTSSGDVKGVSVRLCAVAGAGNSHGVVKAVIDKFMREDEVRLLTNSYKPITYVQEIAEKIVNLVDNKDIFKSYNQFNMVANDSISVSEIADIAKYLLKSNKKFTFTNTSWTGDEQYVAIRQTIEEYGIYGELMCCDEAVEKAMKDILEQEYGVKVKA
jgi:nucleoside-diphosphate-sugar epimerase